MSREVGINLRWEKPDENYAAISQLYEIERVTSLKDLKSEQKSTQKNFRAFELVSLLTFTIRTHNRMYIDIDRWPTETEKKPSSTTENRRS